MTVASKPVDQPGSVATQPAQSPDDTIKASPHAANEALDGLAGTIQDARDTVAPLLNRAAEQASALAQRSLNAVRYSSQHLRDRGRRASDGAANYIKNEPVKAMLIAAAIGAALIALVSQIGRSRDRS